MLLERLLQGMQRAVGLLESLDGVDARALGGRGQHQARAGGLAVHEDGAAAAHPVLAADVRTVESLDHDGELSDLQQAFTDHHGLQCGFCTPGFLMLASTVYREAPGMTDDQIRTALGGQLCRCTGYVGIVRAVRAAAALEDER